MIKFIKKIKKQIYKWYMDREEKKNWEVKMNTPIGIEVVKVK